MHRSRFSWKLAMDMMESTKEQWLTTEHEEKS
jgi:hypothetical protein